MSNEANTILRERAAELIAQGQEAMEEWTSTTPGKVLDVKIAQVIKHLDDQNYDDLFNVSMPSLENYLNELSRAHFENNNILSDRDEY